MLPIIVLKIGAKSNAILFLCFVAFCRFLVTMLIDSVFLIRLIQFVLNPTNYLECNARRKNVELD